MSRSLIVFAIRWLVVAGTLMTAAPAAGTEQDAPLADQASSGAARVGQPAPAFRLETREGETISNRDLLGKVVVLNLWASWCPPCLHELPSLERLRRQLPGGDVVIIGVSVDKGWAEVDRVIEDSGVHLTMALDPEQTVARTFGTSKFPETYIIGPDGKVVRKLIGEQIWDRGDFVAYLRGLVR